jgi:phosphatidylethanolamine/phosphatidyl-N-methylethanolamine N-methyltransferase
MGNATAIREQSHRRSNPGTGWEPRFFQRVEPVLEENIRFLGVFLREPASVGALLPSSRFLARAMTQGCSLDRAETVVELGPGTGAFTVRIVGEIGRSTTFFALELDRVYARSLKARFPKVKVYNDSAEFLPHYLRRHGKKKADCIISGLPWASLPWDVQDRVMDAILASLSPTGTFTTFAYLFARGFPRARQFRQRLDRHFGRVETSEVIWRNLPPAVVYRCSLPVG